MQRQLMIMQKWGPHFIWEIFISCEIDISSIMSKVGDKFSITSVFWHLSFFQIQDSLLPVWLPVYFSTHKTTTSSHHKVFVHWMPRPCVLKQWDLGQKLRCLWKAWSMVFHALKVVKWSLMTPSGHKLTKCKKCQVVTHKKLQKLTISCPELAPRFLGAN